MKYTRDNVAGIEFDWQGGHYTIFGPAPDRPGYLSMLKHPDYYYNGTEWTILNSLNKGRYENITGSTPIINNHYEIY